MKVYQFYWSLIMKMSNGVSAQPPEDSCWGIRDFVLNDPQEFCGE